MFDFGQANEEQKKVIQHTDGPTLIIAGPVAGKTFTLVKRVVYLIVEKGVKPESILIATFTEKAAKELITRITTVRRIRTQGYSTAKQPDKPSICRR